MSPAPVLYIGGWGRSGSTLLSHLLGGLDGMVSVGELRYVWQAGPAANELCGCGEAFADCPFWQAVGREAFGGWDTVDVDEVLQLEADVLRHRNVPLLMFPRLFPGHARKVDRYAELTAKVYEAILKVSGARTVVDSTKNPPYAYFLRRAPGVGLRVLHLVRDSRGVVHSWMRKTERPEITGDAAYFQEFSPWRAGIRWMECNLAFDVLRLRTPTARMRYEALAAEPAGEVARALRSLGEDVDVSALTGGSVEVAGQHSVRGNPMRFAHGRQRVKADEAWRRDMARPVRRTVLALTWPLLWRYGYLRGRHV
jgi:sulfotransferase family protein